MSYFFAQFQIFIHVIYSNVLKIKSPGVEGKPPKKLSGDGGGGDGGEISGSNSEENEDRDESFLEDIGPGGRGPPPRNGRGGDSSSFSEIVRTTAQNISRMSMIELRQLVAQLLQRQTIFMDTSSADSPVKGKGKNQKNQKNQDKNGKNGKNGTNGGSGQNGSPGRNGKPGKNGKNGQNGKSGKGKAKKKQ